MKNHLQIIKKLFNFCEWEIEGDGAVKFIDCFLKINLPLVSLRKGELMRKVKLYYKKGRKTASLEFYRFSHSPPRKMRINIEGK
jgi:hypothetical protein